MSTDRGGGLTAIDDKAADRRGIGAARTAQQIDQEQANTGQALARARTT